MDRLFCFYSQDNFTPLESMIYKQTFYKLITELHVVVWLTKQSISQHRCFNKSLSGLLLQKEKNSSEVPQSSFQVMTTWQSDRWQKQWKILFSLCSHTSGNPRFNNFSFFKPQMNYHLPSKLSLISTTRISSSFGLSKNNLFFLCSTWEVWPYFSDAA